MKISQSKERNSAPGVRNYVMHGEPRGSEPQARPSMAAELRALANRFRDEPVLIAEVVGATHGRGYDLLLILLSLPFITPIPLPFLSTPFGLVICLAGLRMGLGRKPWWPRWFLQKRLPPHFFPSLLRATGRVVAVIEFVVRPRLEFLPRGPLFQRIAGLLIAVCGALLLLPLPIPLSNFFPALTVLLIACAAFQRDGLFFLAGCFSFLLTVGYFLLLAFGGAKAVHQLLGN